MAERVNLAATIPTSVGFLARVIKHGRIFQKKHNVVQGEPLKKLLGINDRTNTGDPTMRSDADNVGQSSYTDQTASEAALRVLGTPELLEMVLLNLSSVDLAFKCALACKAFRDVIDDSPIIQRRLFRAADHESSLQTFPFERWLKGVTFCADLKLSIDVIITYWNFNDKCLFVNPAYIKDSAKRSTVLRNSYITQPPTKLLVALHRHDSVLDNVEHRNMSYYEVYEDSGVTFGHVFDLTEQMRIEGVQKGVGETESRWILGFKLVCCNGWKDSMGRPREWAAETGSC